LEFTLQRVRRPHKLKLELQPVMSLLAELKFILIWISTNMPRPRRFTAIFGQFFYTDFTDSHGLIIPSVKIRAIRVYTSLRDILLLRRGKFCHADAMPVPVVNLAQMREWERATWATDQSEAEVIRRVGQKIAARARELTRPGDSILILAGKGHNGHDALAAKKFLTGRKIEILNVAPPENDVPKLKSALLKNPVLIIDGLFGIGLNRALNQGWKKFIAEVNESKIPILAVDAPSGLNAETGGHFGAAIKAAITLTVGAPKIGMLAQNAWPFVGRLEVAEGVGLIPCPHKTDLNWTLSDDFQNFPPRRPIAGNKGTFGHLAIIAGSFGFHGAGVLTSRAAQRAQPGLVTLFTQEKIYNVVAAQLQAVMVNVWQPKLKFSDSTSAILIGPGLAAPGVAEKMKGFVRKLWRDSDLPLVVDASALDWLLAGAFYKNALRVITPHPGEAARLLKTTAQTIQKNRVAALREISKRLGNCWVVLKGNQTLVGRSRGEIFVNPSGNPHLAQGGSGDVLAGFLAGLLAQPELRADVGKTICYAVWQHGATADKLQARQTKWIVEDLVAAIGQQS
jgi:ADP-dependent NAD(P)H-hydrate dehydratase / NAD(P)H-hydrate epimerase